MENETKIDLRNIINEIVLNVRNKHDIDAAVQIMHNNHISLEQLSKSTLRLNIYDIAVIADRLLALYGK